MMIMWTSKELTMPPIDAQLPQQIETATFALG
jgi:hypothetical protein